jgi:hypothetical protein
MEYFIVNWAKFRHEEAIVRFLFCSLQLVVLKFHRQTADWMSCFAPMISVIFGHMQCFMTSAAIGMQLSR